MLKRYIGDRALYSRVLKIAIPIVIQNTITNFVALLDNIMVGQVGTQQMSGVTIANQLILIFNVCLFGACASAGIFSAQFHGSQDHEGVRSTHRFKLVVCSVLAILAISIFLLFGQPLIGLYLKGEGDPMDAALTLGHGMSYLRIMLIGFIPFALSNAYASSLRETGKTVVPMVAGICAVFVNLFFNYVLIFGHFGAPQMGVRGAALATTLSRFVELAIVAGWTHWNSDKNPFVKGLYHSLHIPHTLFINISKKGLPLLLNEVFWSLGVAMTTQCLSTCGLDTVPAMNINSTIYNLGNVFGMAMGSVVGIIMGQMMGAGKTPEEIRDTNRKILTATVLIAIFFGTILIGFSHLFPMLYNTSDAIRDLSTTLIRISAVIMPFSAYAISIYFTLRSGGKTLITLLVDGGYLFFVCLPFTFFLCHFTSLPFVVIYALSRSTDILRCVLGLCLLRKSKWIQDLTKV